MAEGNGKVISSVKALIKHQGKYLVLKEKFRDEFVWDIPGGKIEYGESPEDTLYREVKEELDIQVEIKRSIGVWYFFSKISRDQIICHTFRCEPLPGFSIDLTKNPAAEEIVHYQWISLPEMFNPEYSFPTSLHQLLSKVK